VSELGGVGWLVRGEWRKSGKIDGAIFPPPDCLWIIKDTLDDFSGIPAGISSLRPKGMSSADATGVFIAEEIASRIKNEEIADNGELAPIYPRRSYQRVISESFRERASERERGTRESRVNDLSKVRGTIKSTPSLKSNLHRETRVKRRRSGGETGTRADFRYALYAHMWLATAAQGEGGIRAAERAGG